MIKSSFSGMMPFLSGALVLSAVALVGCGGGGGSNNRPTATATPVPGATTTPVPGTTVTPVPGTTMTPTPVPTAALSTILFVSDRGGNNDIFSMRSDGSAQTRLTTATGDDNSPSRARNGNRIVFFSLRDGNAEIYTMGISGESSQLQRLTMDAAAAAPADTEPTFSSDGTKIAWVSTRGGAANVWIMDSTGANQTQFTTEGNISSPAFSSSGNEIAFSVVRGGAAVIVAKNVTSGAERVLVQGGFDALAPRYSPDGTLLVFTQRTSNSQTSRLRLLNLASGAVSDGPGEGNAAGNFAVTGSFSPEGNRLAFEATGSPAPQIAVSSGLSGSAVTVLTSQGRSFAPFWS